MADWGASFTDDITRPDAYKAFDESAEQRPLLNVPTAPPPLLFPSGSSSQGHDETRDLDATMKKILSSPSPKLAEIFLHRLSTRQNSAEDLLSLRDAINGVLRSRGDISSLPATPFGTFSFSCGNIHFTPRCSRRRRSSQYRRRSFLE